jgi:hypothetical protein
MAASRPSPVTPTGLGPRLKPGVIDKKVTPVRAKGGPRTPRSTPMPSMGPRPGSRKGLRNFLRTNRLRSGKKGWR